MRLLIVIALRGSAPKITFYIRQSKESKERYTIAFDAEAKEATTARSTSRIAIDAHRQTTY